MTTGRINQVCTQPLLSRKPKPTRGSSFALNQSNRQPRNTWWHAPALPSTRAYSATLTRQTRRATNSSTTPQAPRSRASTHAALSKRTQWVCAFTEFITGSAASAFLYVNLPHRQPRHLACWLPRGAVYCQRLFSTILWRWLKPPPAKARQARPRFLRFFSLTLNSRN